MDRPSTSRTPTRAALHTTPRLHHTAAFLLTTCGTLLLLISLTQPLFRPHFTLNQLLPNLLPFSATTLAHASPTSTAPPTAPPTPERLAHAQTLLQPLGPQHPDGVTPFELSQVLHLALTPSPHEHPAYVQRRIRAVRLLLALFAMLALLASLLLLYTFTRGARPFDALQVGVHGLLGGALTLSAGLLLALTQLDPILAQQLAPQALLYAACGGAALLASALLQLRRDLLLRAPLAGTSTLAAFLALAALWVTL